MEKQNQTTLEIACSNGEYDRALTLLNQAQDPTALQSSLCAAVRNGHTEIVTLLLTKGAEIDRGAVWAASEVKYIPVFQAFLDAGWDPNWSLGHAGTALTRAVIDDDEALVEFLLKHGADPSVGDYIQSHSTLAKAAIHSSTTVAGILLGHGVQVKQSGALESAAYYGRTEMMGYLLDRGADVNEVSDNDWTIPSEREAGLGTALHTAAAQGQKEAVILLLERGADPSLKDTKGKTALQKASDGGYGEIVELLKSKSITG